MNRKVLVIVAVVAAIGAIVSFAYMPLNSFESPLPQLLLNLPATGDGWTGCAPPPFPQSEFDRRLQNAFPAEFSEPSLANELRRDGFVRDRDCKGEPSVHSATFVQTHALFPLVATVYWKSDSKDHVAWIRGSSGYIAP
jgi:hypothetical protein